MTQKKKLAAMILAVLMALLLAAGPAFAIPAKAQEQALQEQTVNEPAEEEVLTEEEPEIELAEAAEDEQTASEEQMLSEGGVSLSEVQLFSEVQALEQKAEAKGAAYNGFLVTLKKNARNLAKSSAMTTPSLCADNVRLAHSAEEIANDYDYEDIEKIEPNYLSKLDVAEVPNDPLYGSGNQDYLDMIYMSSAWKKGLDGTPVSGSGSITVAVIDSGIYRYHEDINANHLVYERNFASSDPTDLTDVIGHGTACASIIMAKQNNGIGMAGIAPEVRIMPLKVFYYDSYYKGYYTDDEKIAAAINYAVSHGADVISMSLSGPESSTVKANAVKNAAAKGVLLIASAGNSDYGHYAITYPAAYSNVVGVGSLNWNLNPSSFSTCNSDSVFCTAVGETICMAGTSGSSYVTQDGTSFSCPQVAAIAALAKSVNRNITPSEFKVLIRDTCTDLEQSGKDASTGYGLINVDKIVKKLFPAKSVTLDRKSGVIGIDETLKLKATVLPTNAAVRTVTWSSSDAKVVRVSSGGTVRGLKPGSEIITAVSKANKKLSAKCRITVLFSDVDKSSMYYKYVHWGLVKGLTGGVNGKFLPEDACARKDLLLFLWRMEGCPSVSGTLPFNDISYSKSSATYKAILWGYKKGLTKGYSDGTFRPLAGVDRGSVVTILYRLAGRPSVSGTMPFPDVTSGKNSDTYRSILWAAQQKITTGYSDGTFRPKETCIRGQAIAFLYRYAH